MALVFKQTSVSIVQKC